MFPLTGTLQGRERRGTILDKPSQSISELLLSYLGNKLPVADRGEFERRLFEDDSFSQQVEDAEFALVEDFAAGSLPAADRELVATWIARTPRLREHLLISRALYASGTAKKERNKIAWIYVWPLAAAASAVCWVGVHRMHSAQTGPAPVTEMAQTTPAPSALPVDRDIILLQAERVRGVDTRASAPVVYPVHADRETQLQILVPQASAGSVYSLDVRSFKPQPGFQPIHRDSLPIQMQSSMPYLELVLPSHSLTQGRYVMDLHTRSGSYRVEFATANAK